MAVFRAFYRSFGRMLFVSVLCFAFGFMSAWAAEYPKITYYNQDSEKIDDLVPDEYTEAGLSREELPNSEAVSIATGCELVDELWYWDDKMSEPVESIEPKPFEDKDLYGSLSCDKNRIVTLNPKGKEGIGSKGTEQLYYYRNLGDYGEFFYNEYNGSKSAAGLASTIILPTYDTEKYTFLGYYADPDDMETQCVDERGYITKYGFQQMAEGGEGETSWDAVYDTKSVLMNTIQLLPMYSLTGATTSPGTGYIYGKPLVYGGGVYDAYYGGNPISSITIPTWSGHSFLGYYSSNSSTSTQYINSVGNITAAGIAKAQESNQTWYGHWSGTHNLHYDCSTNYNVSGQQGHGTAPADESHSAGQSVTLQQNQGCYPTDSYYSFGGWNCFNRMLNNYSGGQFIYTDYNSGPINNGYSLTMPYNDVWCEPNWIPDNVTLSYNCGWLPNTNTPVSGSAPSSVSGSAPLVGNLASAADAQNTCTIDTNTYSFVEWYCTEGLAWRLEPGDVFSITEDATCYAVWAENNPCAPGSEASNSPEILGGAINSWNQISYVNVSLSDLSGMCSETVGSYPGQIGSPSSTTGDYCWCQATSYSSTALNNYPWVFVQFYDGCNVSDCQSWCLNLIDQKDPDYFFNVSLLSKPICEYTLDYNCGTVGGTAPSSVSGIIPTNITQNSPMSLASTAPDCNNGNNILSGWTCYASSDTGYTTPLTSASYSLDTMPYDNVTCYADWTANPTYSVNYTCGQINGTVVSGTISPATNQDQYYAGYTNVPLTSNPNTSGCTGTSNYNFAGWDCHSPLAESNAINNGYVIPTMPVAAVTCGAVWSPKHTLSYDCSACGTSNPASVTLPAPGNTLTLANSCFSGNASTDDYDFLGWHCMLPAGIQPYIGSSYQGGDTYSVASGNDYDTVCYGICRNNSPCGDGETIYEVLGIEVANPDDSDWKDDNIDTGGGTLTDLWNTAAGAGWSGNTTTFNDYSPAPYTIEWRTMCTDNSGVPAMSGNPGSSGGQYCWCGVTNEVFYPDGSTNTLDEYPWVFAGEFADEGECNNDCLRMCNWWLMPEWVDYTGMSWFLHSLYTKTTCEYTVTYHGGSCRANASTFSDTATGGATYTVQNPRCPGSNNIVQSYLPTDGCSEFVGWSNSVSSNNVVYGSCVGGGNCSNPTTGNCGTISNVSNNVDLYAVCQSQLHNVIYHSGNCDSNDYSYIHNSVLNLGSTYTVLSPFVAPLLSQNPASLNISQSGFQGWASSPVPEGEASWCVLDSNKLYSKLVGGKTNNTSFVYQKDGKTCPDIELYAVCCPLNLNWDVNGGSWPVDANNNELTNQSTCIYGSSAGTAGAIGYGQTPLRVPVRTGYTFNGWKVTNYGTP